MPRVPEGAPSEAPAGAAEVRFELTGIILEGVTAYEESDLAPLWQRLARQGGLSRGHLRRGCRDHREVSERRLYPVARDRAAAGHPGRCVRIQVIEGYVDKVTIQGDPGGPIEQITAKADRIKASRPLQASVLEHNLLLMNGCRG